MKDVKLIKNYHPSANEKILFCSLMQAEALLRSVNGYQVWTEL